MEQTKEIATQQIARELLFAESNAQLKFTQVFVPETNAMQSRRQLGAGARAKHLHVAALKPQPDAMRDLAVEQRNFGTRVQVALDFELAMLVRVTHHHPQTREGFPGFRIT